MMKTANRQNAFTLVELLVVIAIIGILIAMLLPAVQSVRESSRRVACMNNVRQIGLAFHSYENNYEFFPAGNFKGHNWTAHLLPFLDKGNLYDSYSFDVSWSHASNQKAITTAIGTYICPSNPNQRFLLIDDIGSGKKAASCDYAAITSVALCVYTEGYATAVADRRGALASKKCELRDVLDGLSNTIMITEDVGRPVHYVARGRLGPDDVTVTSGNLPVKNGRVRGAGWADTINTIPVHGFTQDGLMSPGPVPVNATNNNEAYGFHPGSVIGLLCDGSVQVVDDGITMQEYSEFVTRAGSETNGYKSD